MIFVMSIVGLVMSRFRMPSYLQVMANRARMNRAGPQQGEFMKITKSLRNLSAVVLVLSMTGGAYAAPGQLQLLRVPTEGAEVAANISSVFVPSGFSNADPFVVISGLFPNSCYAWTRAEVTHVEPTLHIIRAMARVRSGMCLMVIVPYTEEAQLGKLDAGEHTLRFMSADGTYLEKKLTIE